MKLLILNEGNSQQFSWPASRRFLFELWTLKVQVLHAIQRITLIVGCFQVNCHVVSAFSHLQHIVDLTIAFFLLLNAWNKIAFLSQISPLGLLGSGWFHAFSPILSLHLGTTSHSKPPHNEIPTPITQHSGWGNRKSIGQMVRCILGSCALHVLSGLNLWNAMLAAYSALLQRWPLPTKGVSETWLWCLFRSKEAN